MSKIVIAPDSFKGSLSAAKLADIVEKAAKERFPRAVAIKIPIADGGEGTLDALLMAVGGEKKRARVTGPDGKPLWAEYARLSDGSFAIELAQCAALTQMQPLDPMRATTLGVGELMRAALRDGARKLRIGIGGSATNDGGMGLLREMNYLADSPQWVSYVSNSLTVDDSRMVFRKGGSCIPAALRWAKWRGWTILDWTRA